MVGRSLSPQSPNSLVKPKRSKLLLLLFPLAIIVLTPSGVIAYKYHEKSVAIAQERTAYSQAEIDMDKTAASIAEKFGKPDDSTKDKSCGYTSNPDEFEKGELYCGTDVYQLYNVQNKASATILTTQIENYLQGKGSPFYVDQTIPANNILPAIIATRSYSFKSLNCRRSYTYDVLQNAVTLLRLKRSKVSGYSLIIDLSCGSRPAKAAIYPIEQN